MTKTEGIFRIIAVTGLVVGVAALIRRESEIKILNNVYYLIRQGVMDVSFAEIVQGYDEEAD